MPKRRKLSERRSQLPKTFDPKDNKLGPIRSFEDIADSEDEFHINRDKILLDEGPEAKRRKKLEEEEALLEPSDEEILGYSEDDDEEAETTENDALDKRSASESEIFDDQEVEDVVGWGSSKRDYYDADNIETEADALEEGTEARRLQHKKLQNMSEADFGFDENDWLDVDNDDNGNEGNIITEVLKNVEISADSSTAERLSILQRRYPEFDSLANEFLQLKPILEELQLQVDGLTSSKAVTKNRSRVETVKYRALAAYMGSLSMYFAIFASTTKSQVSNQQPFDPLELHDHSIMESLLHCRELWSKVSDLEYLVEVNSGEVLRIVEVDISEKSSDQLSSLPQGAETKRSKKEHLREKAAAEALESRKERIRMAEEEVRDLSLLLPKAKGSAKPGAVKQVATHIDSDSDFGEEETLSARALAEKSAKKKSLRFYTSQIAQKANRRADAGRDAGGDADLPYRERLRDRQARLNAEAEKRGKKLDEYGRGSVTLGGVLSEDDATDAEVTNTTRDEEDEYYDMVAQTSQKRKAEKAERYEAIAAAKAAGKQVRVVEGELGEDGKRAIGYVILKNKGLTQKRKKDVRNPRVKKRKKYEEKKKKLSSIRAVYKGGEGRGGYGGEKTGIKTGLVKSIKL